jgi:uncharacterized protein (DUF58 family)
VLLRRTELRLARRLPGRLAGTHAGIGVGPGWQAESARPYQPGVDDVRFMDWPVTARMGEPYVREHEAERELETTVVVDTTPSMAFGTVEWPKRELAAAVVAALGVLTDRPGDRLGALVHGPARAGGGAPGLVRWPPRSGRRARLLLLRALLEATPSPAGAAAADPAAGRGRPGRRPWPPLRRRREARVPTAGVDGGTRPTLAEACRAAASQLRRPGLVVVVSDFLDADVDALGPALRRLAVRHDVLAVQVRDPLESELVDVGVLGVVDPETGAAAVLDTGDPALRAAYREVAAEHDASVAAALRSAGVGHVRVTTGGDWIGELARYVLASRRVRGRAGRRRT